MTNRERVIRAIRFRPNDYAPYNMDFTTQFAENLKQYEQQTGRTLRLNMHVERRDLVPAPQPIPQRPGFYRDVFGVVWNRTGADKDIGVVESVLLEEDQDPAEFRMPPIDTDFIARQCLALENSQQDRFRVACLGFSLFERAWTLTGMENLLCAMVTDPGFVHALMRKICDWNLQVIREAMKYDFEAVYFGDDWGQQRGLIMGLEHWREFIKPYLAEMYALVRENRRFVVQHSCGDLREAMDDLIEIGLDVYQTFQPEIYGLDYAKRLEGRLTIWGGISVQLDLPNKTPQQIREIARQTLRAFPHGGLILSPTHAVPSDVPPENIFALADVMEHQPKD